MNFPVDNSFLMWYFYHANAIVMREWLSGRASPCQGESRGFDPRLPLPSRRRRQVVRHGSAKAAPAVRIRSSPPNHKWSSPSSPPFEIHTHETAA